MAGALSFRNKRPRYQPRTFLFTKAEWQFAFALRQATKDHYLVMGKVRIADLLKVERRKGIKKSDWWRQFVKISSKHIDYVLICPSSGRIRCCIELDDRSHQRKDRAARDAFVNASFKEAGLPLLRVPTKKQYNVHELQRSIQGSIIGNCG